ncbi:MAG: S49 family peptidase [Planctomycetota bacterium]
MSDEPTTGPGEPRPPIDPTGTSTPPPPPPGYVPAVYVQQPSGSKSIGKVVMYLLVVGLLTSVMINVYLSKYGPVATMLGALTAGGLQEANYHPQVTPSDIEDRIVVVEITGTIEGSVAEFAREAFYTLEKDPPAAVVLRVVSGGGGVTASDQIWHAIKSFRAAHPKVPVVSSFGTVAASGGYYIAAPSDYIFCERTGITGSIGVLAQVPALGGMVEKLGVEMNMVIANRSPNKDDANNLFTEWYDDEGNLTEEGDAAVAVLENLVDGAYETFFKVVKTGRQAADATITEEELAQAATGAIFVGEEAKTAKLVDEIGYLDDAIAYAHKEAKLSGEPKVTVLRQPVPGLLSSMIAGKEGADLTNLTGDELRALLDDASAVKLEYRMRIR